MALRPASGWYRLPIEMQHRISELFATIPRLPPLLDNHFNNAPLEWGANSAAKLSERHFKNDVNCQMREIRRAMTVSKAWYEENRPYLHQVVEIQHSSDLLSLAKRLEVSNVLQNRLHNDSSITWTQSQDLSCTDSLRYVRRIIVSVDDSNRPYQRVGWTIARAVSVIVAACPRLEGLILLQANHMALQPEMVLDSLTNRSTSCLRSFSFLGLNIISVSQLAQILKGCPSLEELQITSPSAVSSEGMEIALRTMEGVKLSLVTLMWAMTDSGQVQTAQLLAAMEMPHLRDVMVARAPNVTGYNTPECITTAFCEFLKRHGKQIRFLQIEGNDDEPDNDYIADWLDLCPSLEDLILDPLLTVQFPAFVHYNLRRVGFIHFYKDWNPDRYLSIMEALITCCPQLTTFRCFDGEPLEHCTTTVETIQTSIAWSRPDIHSELVMPVASFCKEYGKGLEDANGMPMEC
ncbi:hypothetical protein CALVIDRAFT_568530 [Calocera viscosa TUFC12733]|uniref:F-box domain-containing protein n=1 Tax=Calocera viscosa (strain TUFC12733) TaxID=1330018 RepID=A0A167GZF4_CALVF|nr:hypothetical protein CALVIDRAFT_568530 [Calocera viscosa TUFC12733]